MTDRVLNEFHLRFHLLFLSLWLNNRDLGFISIHSSLPKLVCKINSSSRAWHLSHVSHDGWWRLDTIATELRARAVATKKARARYTRSMPSGISRPTIAHKTRLWAGVGIVIQSQINLPAIPRRYDKKNFATEIRPPVVRDTPMSPSRSRVLKIDSIACAIAVHNFREVQLKNSSYRGKKDGWN